MKVVDVSEAKTNLAELLTEVERGEEVLIARDGTPVARLCKTKPIRREPGILSNNPAWRDWKYDPSIFAPLMTDEDLEREGFSL
jgi:prevent-host-death family protein